MAKSNQGNSLPNQGDRPGVVGSGGRNQPRSHKSKPAKQDAKKWKSKGIKNPSVPDWLA